MHRAAAESIHEVAVYMSIYTHIYISLSLSLSIYIYMYTLNVVIISRGSNELFCSGGGFDLSERLLREWILDVQHSSILGVVHLGFRSVVWKGEPYSLISYTILGFYYL